MKERKKEEDKTVQTIKKQSHFSYGDVLFKYNKTLIGEWTILLAVCFLSETPKLIFHFFRISHFSYLVNFFSFHLSFLKLYCIFRIINCKSIRG